YPPKELEPENVRRRHGHRRRPRRLRDRRPPAGARRPPARERRAAAPLRARPRDRRRRAVDRAGPVGRPRLRRDAARGARPARAAVHRAPAADADARPGPRAARRGMGRRQRRDGGGARARALARRDARPRALRPRGRPPRALPRRRGDGVELPRHAAPRRLAARRGGRLPSRGARAADAAHDRQPVRADGADRPRRLGDGRAPPRGAPRHRVRAPLRRARGGDAAVNVVTSVHDLDLPRHGIVGLVPTMGALHGGHEALFEAARPECDVLVASLFVNPAQFDDEHDLAAYPRDLDRDAAFAAAAGVDVLFAPPAAEMYPPGFATWIDPRGAAEGLEEAHRPGHFRGVATICVKLFNLVRPQRAWFGRKDAQQIAVLRQVVRDLNMDVEIRAVDTVRDADGLALSSRNARLAPAEREQALAIPRALAILEAAGLEPDYVAVADLDGPTLAVAAAVGDTRLIDNVPLGEGAERCPRVH